MSSVASTTPISGRPKRRLSSRNTNTKGSGAAVANGAYATVANIVRELEDLDDEEHVVRKKSAHSPSDISMGTKRVKISYENEYNNDTISSSFNYIRVNIVFQDAYVNVNFSLARVGEDDSSGKCIGDCLEATFPYACPRKTRSVFAYTRDGCLKEEFLQYEMDMALDEAVLMQLLRMVLVQQLRTLVGEDDSCGECTGDFLEASFPVRVRGRREVFLPTPEMVA
ncbi:hypothetical protein R1sor_009346 [Riccia sorocarpa]|uniref:Uncharacterized protein n=1 Tax=Riccia sorocarpa TaxID=122646 RepID=A0ABD3HYU9_9MARC